MSAKFDPPVEHILQEYILLTDKVQYGVGINDIDLSTPITRYSRGGEPEIKLNIPILSAAMQSVSGAYMAEALAMAGGLGIVYRSQTPENQAAMVRKVKEYKGGFVEPDVFSPDSTIADVEARIQKRGYSTFPVTGDGKPSGQLIGYITEKDFYAQKHRDLKVKDRMIGIDRITYAKLADVIDGGTPSLQKAYDALIDSHHSSLPIVNDDLELLYVVFKRDAESRLSNPHELLDKKRRLMCAAAISTHQDDYETRMKLLMAADVDMVWIDASQGMSDYMIDAIKFVEDNYDVPTGSGNIITEKGFNMHAEAGSHAVCVGMGSGYICSTQLEKRTGRGQATAVVEVAAARDAWYERTGDYIPIISDGGVAHFADITVALELGADAVKVGRLIAGCKESPTKVVTIRGNEQVKPYWGEGSRRAWKWAPERYEQNIFEEGFLTVVPYVGPLKPYMNKGLAKVSAGIRDVSCKNLSELHARKGMDLRLMSKQMKEENELKREAAIDIELAFMEAEDELNSLES
jgi:IMP dehydrogenase